jgi:hypothetical protein
MFHTYYINHQDSNGRTCSFCEAPAKGFVIVKVLGERRYTDIALACSRHEEVTPDQNGIILPAPVQEPKEDLTMTEAMW